MLQGSDKIPIFTVAMGKNPQYQFIQQQYTYSVVPFRKGWVLVGLGLGLKGITRI